MESIISVPFLVLIASTFGATDSAVSAVSSADIGDVAADLQFRDIRGLDRSLRDFGPTNAIVLVFTNTDCPLVKRSMPKLVELHNRFRDRKVFIVAVNTGPTDTIRDMASQALEFEAPFYFVKDTDLSVVQALGITRTPQVAVLNARHELVYRGRIDDQLRLGGSRPKPTRRDLEEAIRETLKGQPVTVPETPVDGCLITKPSSAGGPEPTFATNIAPIIFGHCSRCHRPDTAAPFSLLTFEDVASHAEMIARVVDDQTMPPWYASPDHGVFQNDSSLDTDERRIVQRWARGERLPGDLKNAPAPPESSTATWRIGEPDVIITMLEEHKIPATGFVDYRYTILPYLFLDDTWVESVEIRPDNPAVVHHCNMAYVTSDGADEETFVTGYVPGGQPLDLSRFDNGVAFRFPATSGLGLQIHYTTTGKPERCRIAVGLRFARRKVQKQFKHFLLDPRFRIPPKDPAHAVSASHTMDENITLLGLFTHMHVRGRDMTFYAKPPNAAPELLLQIPNYNFDWQLGYEIPAGTKQFPAGTTIEAIAHFDNSVFNPYNPDPTKTVRYGLQTVDEMFNGFGFYVATDEALNLVIDPTTGYAD
jgi:peroxiredoxin